ncbi:MAG: hypothetical protein NUV74_01475 [Candidatus Brocadiaceae bacterium]|nr:hypothetical protein [Candidatus Brocadiaceae bacterium]
MNKNLKISELVKASKRISFVGGSNTVSPHGYTKSLMEKLNCLCRDNHSFNNFGLGSAPGLMATLSLHRHNLSRHSDIIFHEYWVNDKAYNDYDGVQFTSLDEIGKSLEGFVRMSLKENPNCIIIFLILGTGKDRDIDDILNSRCLVTKLYEEVADHYRLPIINLPELITKEFGKIFLKNLYYKDFFHFKRPEGTDVISQSILTSLDDISYQPLDDLPEPIFAANYNRIRFLEDFYSDLKQGKHEPVGYFKNSLLSEKYLIIKPGLRISFLLKGKLLGLLAKSSYYDGYITLTSPSKTIIKSTLHNSIETLCNEYIILWADLRNEYIETSDYEPISVNLADSIPNNYTKLGHAEEVIPKVDPLYWTFNLVGIVYTGDISGVIVDFSKENYQNKQLRV